MAKDEDEKYQKTGAIKTSWWKKYILSGKYSGTGQKLI